MQGCETATSIAQQLYYLGRNATNQKYPYKGGTLAYPPPLSGRTVSTPVIVKQMGRVRETSGIGFRNLTLQPVAHIPLVEHCVSFASCQWLYSGEDKMAMGRQGPPLFPWEGVHMFEEWDQLMQID